MELLSNGFFKEHNIFIDNAEDIEFSEFYNNDFINIMCYGVDFNINDLQKIDKNNILNRTISAEEYNQLTINTYIEYSKSLDILKVVISIYDFDFINKSLLEYIKSFNKQIDIIINTDYEKNKILKLINKKCTSLGFKDILDFYEKEYK